MTFITGSESTVGKRCQSSKAEVVAVRLSPVWGVQVWQNFPRTECEVQVHDWPINFEPGYYLECKSQVWKVMGSNPGHILVVLQLYL